MHIFDEYKGLRRELYILFIGRMMTNLGAMIWPIFTLILSQKLGMSAGDIGVYMLVYTLVSLPMNLLGGKLADRFNKKNMIVVCDIVSIVGYLYCGFTEINLTAIVVFALASLFQNIEWPCYDALVADFTLPKDRARAYSLSYLGSNLGLVLSPTIGGILFNEHLNLAFLINGFAIMSSTILIGVFIRDVHRETEPEEEGAAGYEKDIDSNVSGWGYIRSNRVVFTYLLLTVFGSAVYGMYNYLMPLDLGIVHGENGSIIFGTLTSVNCIVVVVCTALITRWFRRTLDVDKIFVGTGLELTGFVIFMFCMRQVFLCYVAMIIFTFGEIFNTISTSPFLTRRIPASHRGRIIATVNVIASLGGVLLENLVGRVHDSRGTLTAWLVVLLMGGAELGATALMKRFDKKDYKGLYE